MKCGDRVKVVKLKIDKATNLWGSYDDITCFMNEEGVISNIIDGVFYGVEFDNDLQYIARKRTGYIFEDFELELITE